MNKERLKSIRFTQEVAKFLFLSKDGPFSEVAADLPDDIKIHHLGYDQLRGDIIVVVKSNEYPETHEGEVLENIGNYFTVGGEK